MIEERDPRTFGPALDKLKESGANVIIALVTDIQRGIFFEAAANLSMVRDPYVWIVPDAVSLAYAASQPSAALYNGFLAYYASPRATPGYARFAASWSLRSASECATNAFNATANPAIFGSPPGDVPAFAYDGMIALLSAITAVPATASGLDIFAAITNTSFDGASGSVSFESNGDRDRSTLAFVLDNWQYASDGSGQLSAVEVLSYTSASGFARSSTSSVWPGGGSVPPPDLCPYTLTSGACSLTEPKSAMQLIIGLAAGMASLAAFAAFLVVLVIYFRRRAMEEHAPSLEAQHGKDTPTNATAAVIVVDANTVHRLLEEGLVEVQQGRREGDEKFSLRAFGIQDEHWCMEWRKGEAELLKILNNDDDSYLESFNQLVEQGVESIKSILTMNSQKPRCNQPSSISLSDDSWRQSLSVRGSPVREVAHRRISMKSMYTNKVEVELNHEFAGDSSDLRALLQRLGLMLWWPELEKRGLLLVGQLRERAQENRSALQRKLQDVGMTYEEAKQLIGLVSQPTQRVLCLHGFCTSGGILRSMIKPLMMQLQAEFVFLDGSLRREEVMPDKPVVKSIKAGWPDDPQLMYAVKQEAKTNANGTTSFETSYRDLGEALTRLYAQIGELGPFDGIVAYSQGANLGTIISGAAAQGLIKDQPPFKWGVFFCGSEWGWAEQATTALPGHASIFPVRMPTVIVIGTADPLGHPEAQSRFCNCYHRDHRVVLSHKSGHIPFGPDLHDAWRLAQGCKEVAEVALMQLPESPRASRSTAVESTTAAPKVKREGLSPPSARPGSLPSVPEGQAAAARLPRPPGSPPALEAIAAKARGQTDPNSGRRIPTPASSYRSGATSSHPSGSRPMPALDEDTKGDNNPMVA